MLFGASSWILGRAVLDAGLHVHHGVEDVVVHHYEFGGVRGCSGVVGHHCGHDVADGVHLVNGDGRMGDFLGVGDDPSADEGSQLFVEVRAGIDADNAVYVQGGGGVNVGYPGVGVRASGEGQVQHSDHADVVNVGSFARNQPFVFAAFYALTDQGHVIPPVGRLVCLVF